MRNFIWPRIIERKSNESEIIHPRKAEKRGKNLGHGSHFESFHTDIEFCRYAMPDLTPMTALLTAL
jgi:hypothetical protein